MIGIEALAAVDERTRRYAAVAGLVLWLSLLAAATRAAPVQERTASPPAVEKNPSFAVLEFRILGSNVLPIREVESAVYPFLGETKTLADVEQARDALVAAYRKAGFGTVSIDIPEQSVEDGVVRLKVLEGKLEHVEVKGARYFSGREIKNALPELQPGKVPNLNKLQGELAQLSRSSADRTVQPSLRAGSAPGQVNVVLNVEDHSPFHGALEVNNRATVDTTPTRLSGTVSYDYLFGRPQSLSVQYQTAPAAPSEVNAWAVTWMDRGVDGSNPWTAYFVDSNSDVAALGTVGVLGTGTVLGVRRNFTLNPDPAAGLTTSFGVDYKSFSESITVDPATPAANTPIHYMDFSATVAGNIHQGPWSIDGNGGVTFGIRGLVNEEDQFAYKRSGAHADFFYVRGLFRVAHELPYSTSASLRVGAQWSPDPLIANEQFSLGGVDTVRGYYEAEYLADTAADAALEFASPRWSTGKDPARAFVLSALAFLDGGIGSVEQPLSHEVAQMHLASYGLGFLVSGPWALNGLLDVARTLSAGTRTPVHDTRIHFMLRMGF
jgi:hemolysin activation/secretion protein